MGGTGAGWTRARWRPLLVAVSFVGVAACGADDAASVELVDPVEGSTVAGAVELAMTAEGITIEPAGDVRDDAGHFHVIADADCVDEGEAVPRDADHVHFGDGAEDGTIYLGPGEHELCLQVGDGEHRALDVTDRISLTVGVTSLDEWCRVVEQTDDLFSDTDSSDMEFPDRQVAYQGIQRLLAQLSDGLDAVDAMVRDRVETMIDGAATIADAMVAAEDGAAAEEALMEVFGTEGVQSDPVAADWILDRCGVDIDG